MKKITAAQTRKIHVISRERGIDDDLLHEHIQMLTGKESLKELSCGDAAKVIDRLEGNTPSCRDPASYRQLSYIKGLMKKLGWIDGDGNPDMARLDGMCRKYAKVDSYRWLDNGGASKLIEALKNMAAQKKIDIPGEVLYNG